MKKQKPVLSLICLAFLFLLTSLPVSAAEAEVTDNGFSIHIQKYRLDDKTTLPDNFPKDGSKAEVSTDSNGKSLSPLKDIQYVIERVTPMTEGTGFQVVEGSEAFKETIATDASGSASLLGLPQGMYRVTEKSSSIIKDLMDPVVLELPLPQPNGKEALTDVYIYPKSSVITGKKDPQPSRTNPKDSITKLPQTSGNIGGFHPFVWISLLIMIMGSIGFASMRQKNVH